MFSIEHEFDCTVVTLVDERSKSLEEDVKISGFEECVTVEQYDPRTDTVQRITLSNAQLSDLKAALTALDAEATVDDARRAAASARADAAEVLAQARLDRAESADEAKRAREAHAAANEALRRASGALAKERPPRDAVEPRIAVRN